jgi:hypothetical protein
MTAAYLHSTSPRWWQTVRTGTAGHAQVPIGQILEPGAPGQRKGRNQPCDRPT